jgi:ubiquinone/menaquinone biosynthesis C-methylase UbiE
MNNNTTRFSDRVEEYIKYRPTYPSKLLAILKKELKLNFDNTIADIGSGTGISSIPFLDNNNIVYGVEPNKEMREAAEQILKKYPKFISINGAAEETTLPDKSIDIIFCGQAFHWFDKTKSKKEFDRILKDNGHIVFVWNSRSTKSDFQNEYEDALFENIDEYKFVNHRTISDDEIREFFAPKTLDIFRLYNKQNFNLEGLQGRLKSSSYCPKSGPGYDRLMVQIESIYKKYEVNDNIEFEYETQIYCRSS